MQKNNNKLTNVRRILLLLGLTVIIFYTGIGWSTVEAKSKDIYRIKINRVYNTITVYQMDDEGKFTKPIKAMLCSVGTGGRTKTGTFYTKAKYRWKLLMGNVWGQYSTRIVDGILFHSVYYYGEKNPSTLATKEFNKLGTTASHGCVRLSVKDAKWIYDNCAVGTAVTIYDDKKSPGPLGKPDPIKVASNVRWDPTDPDKNNPFLKKQPALKGIKSQTIEFNEKINLLSGVKATSSYGTNISSLVNANGKVDSSKPGKYKITYSVKDALGKKASKEITVTVLNNKIKPDLEGIKNKIVDMEVKINKEFALIGVKAYLMDKKIDTKLIKVTIDKNSDSEYKITYELSVGNGPSVVKKSIITVDKEGPVIYGISDLTMEQAGVPTKEDVMKNITVSDNYTSSAKIKLDVTLTDNQDGTYLVTYMATDEAGNTTTKQAKLVIKLE